MATECQNLKKSALHSVHLVLGLTRVRARVCLFVYVCVYVCVCVCVQVMQEEFWHSVQHQNRAAATRARQANTAGNTAHTHTHTHTHIHNSWEQPEQLRLKLWVQTFLCSCVECDSGAPSGHFLTTGLVLLLLARLQLPSFSTSDKLPRCVSTETSWFLFGRIVSAPHLGTHGVLVTSEHKVAAACLQTLRECFGLVFHCCWQLTLCSYMFNVLLILRNSKLKPKWVQSHTVSDRRTRKSRVNRKQHHLSNIYMRETWLSAEYSNWILSCKLERIQKFRPAEKVEATVKRPPAKPAWRVPLRVYSPSQHRVTTMITIFCLSVTQSVFLSVSNCANTSCIHDGSLFITEQYQQLQTGGSRITGDVDQIKCSSVISDVITSHVSCSCYWCRFNEQQPVSHYQHHHAQLDAIQRRNKEDTLPPPPPPLEPCEDPAVEPYQLWVNRRSALQH